MFFDQFVSLVIQNLNIRNAGELSKLFSIFDRHAYAKNLVPYDPTKMKMGNQYFPWREMIAFHVQVLTCLHNNEIKNALENQFKLTDALSELFDLIKEDNWFLPVMYTIVVDLRSLGSAVDHDLKHESSSCEHLKRVSDTIMKLYRKCVSDVRTTFELSKKVGMMVLSNQLFKIFFQINQLNLCKPLITALDNLKILDKFSVSQRVTYNYYVGRKAMFEDKFDKADECLTFAFENCHLGYLKNKRSILIYLIPVKMLLGIFPDPGLLEKYNLLEFRGIVNSVKSGDLHQLEEELNINGSFFIGCGIYMILEKLKYIAYRNLFKVVSQLIGSHMIPIAAFADALKHVGISDIDVDETECILGNLIFENKIKGYLAHQQQKLVLSKTTAFPSIRQTTITVTR